MNIYLGNRAGADGLAAARLGGSWDELESRARRAGHETTRGQDRFYLSLTGSEIAKAPSRWFRLLVTKFVWTFQNEEPRDSHSIDFFRQHSMLLRWLLPFSVLLSLAAAGLYAAIREKQPVASVVVFAVACIATTVLLVAGMRYRLPLVIALAPLAGNGLNAIFEMWKRRDTRSFTIAVFIVAITTIATLAWHHDDSHRFAEEWSLTALSLNHERDLAAAREAAARAIESNPQLSFAWDVAGVVALNAGDLAGAAQKFDRAIDLDPGFTAAHRHAAIASGALGNAELRFEHLRRAFELRPDDEPTRLDLAEASIEKGDGPAAVALLTHAPVHDQVRRDELKARALAIQRRFPEALRFARSAASAHGSDQRWLLVAMLAIDANEPGIARAALDHVAVRQSPAFDAISKRLDEGAHSPGVN
jgi:tetratricopeptide (TPR) repeat protein